MSGNVIFSLLVFPNSEEYFEIGYLVFSTNISAKSTHPLVALKCDVSNFFIFFNRSFL